jgi:hypothetical protein
VGPTVCIMLDGAYEIPTRVDGYTKKWIKQFHQNSGASNESPSLSIIQEEWIAFWKGAKERMSCASHTMQFVTWKVVAYSNIISEFDALL